MAEQTNLIKKLAILLFIIELAGWLVASLVGAANPTLTAQTQTFSKFSGFANNINATTASLSNSAGIIGVQVGGATNWWLVLGEGINALVQIFALIIECAILLIFSLLFLIPSFFRIASFGMLSVVFSAGYYLMLIVLGIYAGDLLLSLIRGGK